MVEKKTETNHGQESKDGNGDGPKFFIDIEGVVHEVEDGIVTYDEILALGGWEASLGILQIDLKTQESKSLEPGAIVEIKPGMGFSKKVRWKRGAVSERALEEVNHIRKAYPNLEFEPNGAWVLIPEYQVGKEWNRQKNDVAFQISPGHPGTPPYGIYVRAGLRINGKIPNNYKESGLSSRPPFGGEWGMFSWSPDSGNWRPGASVISGTNLLDFVQSFKKRFIEGV